MKQIENEGEGGWGVCPPLIWSNQASGPFIYKIANYVYVLLINATLSAWMDPQSEDSMQMCKTIN